MAEKEKYEGENKNYFKKMTNEEYRVNSPDYRELIIEMVSKMENEDFIFKIYHYILAKYKREKEAGV